MSDAVNIKLWHHILTSDGANYQRYWDALDAEDQARANSIKNESRHDRYVTVHGLLRIILSNCVHLPPQLLKINKMRHGKPYLAEFPELAFNLSHTSDTLVIAVAQNCQLGVDIERCKPRTTLTSLVDRCFSEIEAAWWYALPEIKKTKEFYRFWTRKEAFVKATGHGIALGLNRCVINPENSSEWLSVPECCGRASKWSVRDIEFGEELCSAVVADREIAAVELITA